MPTFKMKQCSKCNQVKELSQFHKDKSKDGGLRYQCKECANEVKKAWYAANFEKVCAKSKAWNATNPEKKSANHKAWSAANPEKVKEYQLKRNFGISLADYNQMFANQSGCCAICKCHQTEFKKKLSVDHSHSTGEIRGLLCHCCNTGIGHLSESDSNLEAASRYLNQDSTIILGSEIKLELKLSDSPKSLANSELKNIFSTFFV